MIESSRFYCVSCGIIVSVAGGFVEMKEKGCRGDQVFRTGFYRSEMPLGCCETCLNHGKSQGINQFSGQYDKNYDTLDSYEKRA